VKSLATQQLYGSQILKLQPDLALLARETRIQRCFAGRILGFIVPAQ